MAGFRIALELAIAAHAPAAILDRLGRAAGLLDAITELSVDAPSATVLMPDLISDAHAAVKKWKAWERERAATA